METIGTNQKMHWVKKGLVFEPKQRYPWMVTHAQLPTVDHIEGSRFRIYFASRDESYESTTSFVELDIRNPAEAQVVSQRPVLLKGKPGCFDWHGAVPSSIVTVGSEKYLYYTGWQRAEAGLFIYEAGLAISTDGGLTFERYSDGPILPRSLYDPCLVASPYVFLDDNRFRMLYISGTKWEKITGGYRPYYHIKYAESGDGIHWQRNGDVAVDFNSPEECAIARTCVKKDGAIYKAWCCYASTEKKYRLGYAESPDGIRFQRNDELINCSASQHGFDSEMMCYPDVFSHDGRWYMLYNGNSYGKEGFALAELEEGDEA